MLSIRVQTFAKNEASCHEANTNLVCVKCRFKQLIRFNDLTLGKGNANNMIRYEAKNT